MGSPAPQSAFEKITQPQILRESFSNSVLIIPKPSEHSARLTCSHAAIERSTLRDQLEIQSVKKPATVALRNIGMGDLEKFQAARVRAPDAGAFNRLGSLGMTIAFFDDAKVIDEAKTELSDEYEFVPDFPLALPGPVGVAKAGENVGSSSPETLNSQWPEFSGVLQAHREKIRGAGVLVGVLDTGVDADHPELENSRISYRYISYRPTDTPHRDIRGFDTDGHGTHVCGILAGKHIGVAPEASLYVASVIEGETVCSSLIRVALGLDWILKHMSSPENQSRPAVLNLSLGFPSVLPDEKIIPAHEWNSRVKTMRLLIGLIVQANVLPIVAIGNVGTGRYCIPGGFHEVVGVGAVDFDGKRAPFSGCAELPQDECEKPDIMGYGVDVYSSVERRCDGTPVYKRFDGTSMAAAYVAGIATLYRCQRPQMSIQDTVARLRDSAVPSSEKFVGAGLARFVL